MKVVESNIFYSNGTGMENNKFNRNTLKQQVKCITKQYLEDMSGQENTDVYKKIVTTVEAGIFEELMTYTKGNQLLAAKISGMSRNTIRKKISDYNIHIK